MSDDVTYQAACFNWTFYKSETDMQTPLSMSQLRLAGLPVSVLTWLFISMPSQAVEINSATMGAYCPANHDRYLLWSGSAVSANQISSGSIGLRDTAGASFNTELSWAGNGVLSHSTTPSYAYAPTFSFRFELASTVAPFVEAYNTSDMTPTLALSNLEGGLPNSTIVIQHRETTSSSTDGTELAVHNLYFEVNRPVSKLGLSAFDLDTKSGYREGANIISQVTNGQFSLSAEASTNYVLSNGNDKVIPNRMDCSNASTTTCYVYADWTDIDADTEVAIQLFNLRRGYHGVSYGNFYACIAPKTISGTVFADIGASTADTSDPADVNLDNHSNSNYADGVQNGGEPGISGSILTLYDGACDSSGATTSTSLATATTASDGSYLLELSDSAAQSYGDVCLVQTNTSAYPLDTTSNFRTLNLTDSDLANPTTSYTENFGDLPENYHVLLLEKYQHIHDCDSSFSTTQSDYTKSGATAEPNQCVTYKIEATNRGNIDLSNVVINDTTPDNTAVSDALGNAFYNNSTQIGFNQPSSGLSTGYTGDIAAAYSSSLSPTETLQMYFDTYFVP